MTNEGYYVYIELPNLLILQGVPKNQNYWNNVLLEFECLNTLLNPHVHKSLVLGHSNSNNTLLQ
jgi:hypothetical protein